LRDSLLNWIVQEAGKRRAADSGPLGGTGDTGDPLKEKCGEISRFYPIRGANSESISSEFAMLV
jgi:hypothetical protein